MRLSTYSKVLIIHSKSEDPDPNYPAKEIKLSANLSKNAMKWPKNSHKWPKMAQIWPKMAKISSRMTQNGPKMTRTFFRNFFWLKRRFRQLFRFSNVWDGEPKSYSFSYFWGAASLIKLNFKFPWEITIGSRREHHIVIIILSNIIFIFLYPRIAKRWSSGPGVGEVRS